MPATLRKCARILTLLAVLGVMPGCGQKVDGPDRFDLSGKITFNGEPIPKGTIMFEPDADNGNSGPGSYVEFENGEYATQSEKGLVGGAYLARVQGFDGVPIKTAEGTFELGTPLFDEQILKIEVPKEDSTQDLDVTVKGNTKKK